MSKIVWAAILITSVIVPGCAAGNYPSAKEAPPATATTPPTATQAPKNVEKIPAIPAYSNYQKKSKVTEVAKEEARQRVKSETETAEKSPPTSAEATILATSKPTPAITTAAHIPVASAVDSGAAIYYAKSAEAHTPARDFCIRGENCGSGYAAYGYIIFTKRPTTDATKQRYIFICKTFISHLEPVSAYTNHIPKSQIATTFWLLSSKPKDANSCDELIELYDYARATEIALSIKKLDSAGPLLVAWTNFNIPQEGKSKRLLIDLGRFTQNDLDSAFRIWRDKISKDQQFWGKGFDMNLILAEFKSLIEKYGETIIQAVKPS